MKETMCILVLALLFSTALCIRDISGGWQGTLQIGGQDLKVMVKVERGDDGGWTAAVLSVDQSPDRCASILAALFALQGSDINFAIDQTRSSDEGRPGAGRTSISGSWTLGVPLLLEVLRATEEAAWVDPPIAGFDH